MDIYVGLVRSIAFGLGLFSPKWAGEYLHRHNILDKIVKRAYVAGKTTGPNQQWRPTGTSADTEIRKDGALTRWRAQDLERNNPFVRGLVRRYRINVVGDGLWPRPLIRGVDGQLNKALISLVSDTHEEWAEHCGVDGSSLYDIQNLIAGHLFVDGEVFEITSFSRIRGMQIQVLEAGQLNETIDGPLSNGNVGVRGVEISPFGLPVAYHFWEAHPGDSASGAIGQGLSAGNSKKIPADRVRHIFVRERASQHRGICHFASIVQDVFDTIEYKDSTMVLARLAAAWGIFVETPHPEDLFGTEAIAEFTASIGASKHEYINPGGIHYLFPDQKPHGFKPEQPTAQYKEFQRQGLLGASVGAGDSYENFTNDYAGASWSSARQGMLQARALYRFSSNLLDRLCNFPTYRDWLDFAVGSGFLAIPGYMSQRRKFQRVKFSRPRLEWIDPKAEVLAAEKEVHMCINSRTQIIEDRGGDRDEVFDLLEEEMAEMKRRGIWQQDPTLDASSQDITTESTNTSFKGGEPDASTEEE